MPVELITPVVKICYVIPVSLRFICVAHVGISESMTLSIMSSVSTFINETKSVPFSARWENFP